MNSFILKRFNSTSCTKFYPLIDGYKTLRHVHFNGITNFQEGQNLQQSVLDANLSFKQIESKIKKNQAQLASQGFKVSEYEEELLSKIMAMRPMPTLLTFEFNNVYTGGKKVKKDPEIDDKLKQFKDMGCEFHQLERGGDLTWHGNGQLVAYLILDLKLFKHLTVRCFVDSVLLKSVQDVLQKNYQLNSLLNENPGVWLDKQDQKIASIGCNIQRGITTYGSGLNVNPDLKYLNTFTMCGLPDTKATSIQEQKPESQLSIKEVAYQYSKQVASNLNITTVEHVNGEEVRHQMSSSE